jgi:hypothetical protein
MTKSKGGYNFSVMDHESKSSKAEHAQDMSMMEHAKTAKAKAKFKKHEKKEK